MIKLCLPNHHKMGLALLNPSQDQRPGNDAFTALYASQHMLMATTVSLRDRAVDSTALLCALFPHSLSTFS